MVPLSLDVGIFDLSCGFQFYIIQLKFEIFAHLKYKLITIYFNKNENKNTYYIF